MPFELEILRRIQRKGELYAISLYLFQEFDCFRFQGTWRYMSRNVLDGENPHTYIDDLESFYFVLCWILMVYSGPHEARATPPKRALWWDDEDSATMKIGHFGRENFRLPVDPWFGPYFKTLAIDLWDFFHVRCQDTEQPLSTPDSTKDYDEYLGCVQRCIVDMEAEDLAKHQASSSSSG
jgi:Fungal protein kinase